MDKVRQFPKSNQGAASGEELLSTNAEQLLLGTILVEGATAWRQCGHLLEPSDFSSRILGGFWELMHGLVNRGLEPSLGGLTVVMTEQPEIIGSQVPSLSWLMDLDGCAVRGLDLGKIAMVIRRKASDRQAAEVGEYIQKATLDGYSKHTEDIDEAHARLKRLQERAETADKGLGTLQDCVDSIGDLNTFLSPPRGQIPTPFPALNRALNGGFLPGQLVIVAARPGQGKTTLGVQEGIFAAQRGIPTRLFELEMDKESLIKRCISQHGQVHHDSLVRGEMNPSERWAVQSSLTELCELPLDIRTETFALRQILSSITQGARKGLRLAIVDYIGLIEVSKRFDNRTQEIGHITRSLKMAAKQSNIPIIALAQLSRANDTEDRPPRLSDLRDGGTQEQDADTVILLHQPSKMKKNQNAPQSELQVIIAKQRNGSDCIKVYLEMQGYFCRMIERERAEATA